MKTILDISYISELIMVNISIWNRNTCSYNSMLITVDTGASVTTISKDILHTLGYDVSSGVDQRIITASNIEYVKAVCIDKVMVGNIEIENVVSYAHTFPESSFSLGVLGLNVLKMYDVLFCFSNNTIELTSRY